MADNNNIPTCQAFQENHLAIDGNNVYKSCLACQNRCLIAYHPHNTVAQGFARVTTGKFQSLEGFKAILTKYITPNDKIINRIIQTQSARMMNCLSDELALQLYKESEQYPQTTTIKLLGACYDIHLNGIFLQGAKSVLINALDKGIPKIFKIPSTQAEAQHEGNIGTILENDNCSNLVPLRYIELTNESNTQVDNTRMYGEHDSSIPIIYGVIMPKYAGVISQYAKVSPITIEKWSKEVLNGIFCLHSHELCHGDIKPMNIFLQYSGEALLGDYGAVTKFGFPLREYSQAYMPKDFASPIIASKLVDYYLLAITALEMLGLWKPIEGCLTSENIRNRISKSDVVNIFQELL